MSTTTFYDTGPPEGHATPFPGQGTEIGVVRRTRHTRREINRYHFGTQPAAESSVPSVRSMLGEDLRRAQLEAIAGDEQSSEDAHESARGDLWLEFRQPPK